MWKCDCAINATSGSCVHNLVECDWILAAQDLCKPLSYAADCWQVQVFTDSSVFGAHANLAQTESNLRMHQSKAFDAATSGPCLLPGMCTMAALGGSVQAAHRQSLEEVLSKNRGATSSGAVNWPTFGKDLKGTFIIFFISVLEWDVHANPY